MENNESVPLNSALDVIRFRITLRAFPLGTPAIQYYSRTIPFSRKSIHHDLLSRLVRLIFILQLEGNLLGVQKPSFKFDLYNNSLPKHRAKQTER